jgi:AraC-like DNA-binding protein
MDQNIKLESLAATAELSLYHFDFARTFKQSEGTTPHAFVLKRRLVRARELLARTDLSLSKVAFAVGFADQSHFTRDAPMAPALVCRSIKAKVRSCQFSSEVAISVSKSGHRLDAGLTREAENEN